MSNIIKKLDVMVDIIKKYSTYSFVSSKFTHIDSVDRFVYDGKRYISRKSILYNLTDNINIFNKDDTIKLNLLDPLDYKVLENMTKKEVIDYLKQASVKIINFLETKWDKSPFTPGLTYDNTFFMVDYLNDYVPLTADNYKPEYKAKIQYIIKNFDPSKQVFADNQVNNYLVNSKDDIKYCDLDDVNTWGEADYLVIHKDNEKQFIKLENNIFNPNDIKIFDES